MIEEWSRLGLTLIATALFLPYVARWDLVALAGLRLRGPQHGRAGWPLVTWVRALRKTTAQGAAVAHAAAAISCLLLLGAAAAALWGTLPLVWAVALVAIARAALAALGQADSLVATQQSASLFDALAAVAVLALALLGPVSLAVAAEMSGAPINGWLPARQPLALLTGCLAITGDAPHPQDAGQARLTFHWLHAGGWYAWQVSASYAWWMAGSAIMVSAFLPALPWLARAGLYVATLAALLWLRRRYVADLRQRLGGWYWPGLATLAGASVLITVVMLVPSVPA